MNKNINGIRERRSISLFSDKKPKKEIIDNILEESIKYYPKKFSVQSFMKIKENSLYKQYVIHYIMQPVQIVQEKYRILQNYGKTGLKCTEIIKL